MAASWRRGEMAQAFWRCMAEAINGVSKIWRISNGAQRRWLQ
jgi:hypothetical protein